MKLIWSEIALARIESIHEYIRVEQPAAATRIVKRLQRAGDMVAEFPKSGRPLRRKGTFIYAVPKTRYLIVLSECSRPNYDCHRATWFRKLVETISASLVTP